MANTGRVVGIDPDTGVVSLQLDADVRGAPGGAIIQGHLRMRPGGQIVFAKMLEQIPAHEDGEVTEAEQTRVDAERENVERARKVREKTANLKPA